MNRQDEKNRLIGPIGATGCLIILILLVVLDAPGHWQMAPVLLGIAFAVGFGCGLAEAKAITRRKTSKPAPPNTLGQSGTGKKPSRPEGSESDMPMNMKMLEQMLEELAQMHKTEDLTQRYQCFTRLTESMLGRAVGPCSVSLWVPDSDHAQLIECVIRPNHSPDKVTGSLANRIKLREPVVLPIDSVDIRRSLQNGEPFIVECSAANGIIAAHSPNLQLRHDGCIPLYRQYGEPLLIIFEHTAGGIKPGRKTAFDAAVEMIQMFWNHLQGINQRQWMVEHDPSAEAVRADTFLNVAQAWADRLQHQDELFTVAVITIQGFRRIFAGTSQKWHTLYGIVSRSINRTVSTRNDEFLLGAMADDVLAIFLPRKDAFISRALMATIMKKITDQLQQEADPGLAGIIAIKIRWRLTDHRQYHGSIQEMLDEAYRKLFDIHANDDQNHSCHIDLATTKV